MTIKGVFNREVSSQDGLIADFTGVSDVLGCLMAE